MTSFSVVEMVHDAWIEDDGGMPPAKSTLITTPAPKYGPTRLYGGCELDGCDSGARVTCTGCGGHFCRNHESHRAHHDVSDEAVHKPG
jgi:hypothetical protein